MSKTFRNVIACEIQNQVSTDWENARNGDSYHFVTNIPDAADAVLTTPQMQAIKRCLSEAVTMRGYEDDPIKMEAKLSHLLDSLELLVQFDDVVEWVLS